MDFSDEQPGTRLSLKSLPFSGVSMEGMMRRMHGRMGAAQDLQAIPQGADFTILDFDVSDEQGIRMPLPERLSQIERPSIERAVNDDNPRQFNFLMQRMNWTINGRVFEMERVSNDETVRLNTKEIWEFINRSQGMGMMGMMNMPHPIHVHGLQFRIIERTILDSAIPGWNTVKEGFIDQGLKDTLILFPGMRVKALMEFEDYAGLFLYHCHNLEHEDMGMMRNYLIRA
jgi:FtsP/CotA-like multicopper oxidase with cupredoxin domain